MPTVGLGHYTAVHGTVARFILLLLSMLGFGFGFGFGSGFGLGFGWLPVMSFLSMDRSLPLLGGEPLLRREQQALEATRDDSDTPRLHEEADPGPAAPTTRA